MRFLGFLFGLLCVSCTSNPSQFELRCAIEGLKKGTVILETLRDGHTVEVDRIAVNKPKRISFTGDLKQPKMFWLSVLKKEKFRVPIFMEPGEMIFDAHIDSLYIAKVRGSQNQTLYEEYRRVIATYFERENHLIKGKIWAYKQKNQVLLKEIASKELKAKRDRYAYVANFLISHPAEAVSGYIALRSLPYLSPFLIDTVSSAFSQANSKSMYIKSFLEMVGNFRDTKVGKIFPPVEGIKQVSLAGDTIRISEIQSPKLMIFWDPEDEKSRALLRKISSVYRQLTLKEIIPVYFAITRDRKKWESTSKEILLKGYNLSDLKGRNNEMLRKATVIGIPHLILINDQNKIVWRDNDFKDFTSLTKFLTLFPEG